MQQKYSAGTGLVAKTPSDAEIGVLKQKSRRSYPLVGNVKGATLD
jgi:hypothetical protein